MTAKKRPLVLFCTSGLFCCPRLSKIRVWYDIAIFIYPDQRYLNIYKLKNDEPAQNYLEQLNHCQKWHKHIRQKINTGLFNSFS